MILWRREWQPIPEFLPGEPHGQRSLAGYSPRGRKKPDMTEATERAHMHAIKDILGASLLILILITAVFSPTY